MAAGKKLAKAEIVRALDLVRSGRTVRTAAATLDCAPATLHRIFAREFPDEYAQALQDRSASKADQADDDMERWKDEEDCAPTIRLAYVKRWNPAYRDKQQVEVTGTGGGAVEIEDRSASLSDVARILEAVGALAQLGGGARRAEVSADRQVLPAPRDA